MANEKDIVSHQLLSSLRDLSMEMTSLGLDVRLTDDFTEAHEVCEVLLSAAWSLINLVHSDSLGLNEIHRHVTTNESLLQRERDSLKSQIAVLRNEIEWKEKASAESRGTIQKLECELRSQRQSIQKQRVEISHLSAQLKSQDVQRKHVISKLEVDCKRLQDLLHGSLGIAAFSQQPVISGKLGDAFSGLTISNQRNAEVQGLQEATLKRLKVANHTLVQENLMLRDTVKKHYSDIKRVLEVVAQSQSTEARGTTFEEMPDSIFRLPLSLSMKKLRTMTQNQIAQINLALKMDSAD